MSIQQHTTITKISDFYLIDELLKKVNKNHLVLFDVDEVLIMDQEEYRLTHPYRREWVIDSKARLDKHHRDTLFSIILKDRNIRLVDPYITAILTKLWHMGIPTAALTKLYTGKFGIIEDLTNWRIKELNNVDIDFTRATPIKDTIILDTIDMGRGFPMITEGIIFTADIDKGHVLENILLKAKYFPETIIFFDDLMENILSVEKMCKKWNINYYGFEFDGASLIPEAELHKESEKIRFNILEQEHRWTTDFIIKLKD